MTDGFFDRGIVLLLKSLRMNQVPIRRALVDIVSYFHGNHFLNDQSHRH